MTEYIRISENYNNNKLVPYSSFLPLEHIKNKERPYFFSMMKYNESQYQEWKKTNSLAGQHGGLTDKIWFDFDSENNIPLAFDDAKVLYKRLVEHGFKDENIQISFSGNKGVGFIVVLDDQLTLAEVRSICFTLAQDLNTFDTSMYDHQRIFRLLFTKNEKSGLYKIPLTSDELLNYNIADIKNSAKDVSGYSFNDVISFYQKAVPSNKIIALKNKAPKETKKKESKVSIKMTENLDLSNKPTFLTNCRWYLQNGFFEEGNRSKILLCLASTYKNLGYTEELVYRMLKGVAEIQSKRNGTERFPDEEIYNNIVVQVFNPTWKNGQYSCKEEGNFLYDYCRNLGHNGCKHEQEKDLIVNTDEVFSMFKTYAENFDKNVLFTGIDKLDKRLKLMVGTSNAIVASPGVGKTSLLLSILNHNSLKDVNSIFFSYDMFHSALYMRMIQKHTGLDQDEIYDIFKHDQSKMNEINNLIKDNYKNIHFCFKSGQSTEEIENTIKMVEEKRGEKVKLIAIDYNELISSPMSDSTAASAQVAQRIRQIANDREVCALQLLQPSKNYSSAADEIKTYNAAKGSSSIAQSMTMMLGCSRPGFNPLNPETDKFFNITCLKNRNGPLFSLDFSWEGLRGDIQTLEQHQQAELDGLREAKKQESSGDSW